MLTTFGENAKSLIVTRTGVAAGAGVEAAAEVVSATAASGRQPALRTLRLGAPPVPSSPVGDKTSR
jgi:hypothetical protein